MSPLNMLVDLRVDREDLQFKVRRRLLTLTTPLVSALAGLLTKIGRRPLVGPASNPIVSLTSYGDRVATVHRTIESIGRGTLRPSRLVLWLDDPAIFQDLPRTLKLQRARGLEIRLTENLGPHTKYFPLMSDLQSEVRSFATADDDIIYPPWWLYRLALAAATTPGFIVCHRAHRMTIVEAHILPYAAWPSVLDTKPHPTVFATGVSGVLYPPRMALALQQAGRAFEHLCPSTDDVWLHRVALDNEIPVRQVANLPKHFWILPGSQSEALMGRNLGGANDEAVSVLYRDPQVRRLSGKPTNRESGRS